MGSRQAELCFQNLKGWLGLSFSVISSEKPFHRIVLILHGSIHDVGILAVSSSQN